MYFTNASNKIYTDGFGRVFRGEFLRQAGRGASYNCLFVGVTQRF